jgi:hypothetical protein
MKLSIEKITEGKKIASEIAKGNRDFKNSVLKGTSIDVRLGKFLMELEAFAIQNGLKGKKKSPLLQQAGVQKISKQRRSDALVLAKNLEEIQAFITSTKWNEGSTSSLLRDWRLSKKPTASDTSKKPTASDEKNSEADGGEASDTSKEVKPLTGQELAKLVLTYGQDSKAIREMLVIVEAALARKEAKASTQVSNVVALAN